MKNKSPNLAANLLRELHVELYVYVDTPKKQSTATGSVTSISSDGIIPVPSNFPPTVTYELVPADSAPSTSVLFSPGVNSVTYIRKEEKDSMIGVGASRVKINLDEQKIKYLAKIADIPTTNLSAANELNVKWKDLKTYKHEVDQQVQKINQAFDVLIQILIKKRMLSTIEAVKVKPKVSVHVLDFRLDKTITVD